MKFDFSTAGRIIFGAGALAQAGELAAGYGRRAFLVTGRRLPDPAPLMAHLEEAGVAWVRFTVEGEPSVPLVQSAVKSARAAGCDLVIGFGGGSVLDAAKAVSAVLANQGEVLDYLEVVGGGQPLKQPALPCIAIPTTAGTGTEVTRNAVLSVPEKRVKVSMRSRDMIPRAALLDPELTYSMPPAVTASTGMDAFTQLIEPYVSIKANPFTDLLCIEGMRRAAYSMQRAYRDGTDAEARADMAWASLLGGMALANAGLGAVHGFAGPLGGMFAAPHGAVCARLLPPVFEANLQALRTREPRSPALVRFRKVAQVVTGYPDAAPEDGVEWLEDLARQLQILPLGAYGITSDDLPTVVEKAQKASSMRANPIVLTAEELTAVLEKAM